jgi:prepilin-type processing-associated H-X9-DG protein
LKHLHAAYTVKVREGRAWPQRNYEGSGQGNIQMMNGWPAGWLRYAGGGKELFVCPEDKTPTNIPLGLLNIYDLSSTMNDGFVCTRSIWEPGKTSSMVPGAGGSYTLTNSADLNGAVSYSIAVSSVTATSATVTGSSKSGSGASRYRYELTDWSGQTLNTNFHGAGGFTLPLLPTSYAIQPEVYDWGFDSSILLLDYPAHTVATNNWRWNTATPPHNGKINVLFRDGHVELRTPSEVAPTSQVWVVQWFGDSGHMNQSGSRTNHAYWGKPLWSN